MASTRYDIALHRGAETIAQTSRLTLPACLNEAWSLAYRGLEAEGALATNRAWDAKHAVDRWDGRGTLTVQLRGDWSLTIAAMARDVMPRAKPEEHAEATLKAHTKSAPCVIPRAFDRVQPREARDIVHSLGLGRV